LLLRGRDHVVKASPGEASGTDLRHRWDWPLAVSGVCGANASNDPRGQAAGAADAASRLTKYFVPSTRALDESANQIHLEVVERENASESARIRLLERRTRCDS
jgi:hypothetical protein